MSYLIQLDIEYYKKEDFKKNIYLYKNPSIFYYSLKKISILD